jgi:transcriptional regulator with XRE-family HTH domain
VGVATPDLRRLAERVAQRRRELNLPVTRAAEAAGVSRDTWKRVERGEPVRHLTYDKLEAALRWTAGSCQKIMDGGEAVPLDERGKSGRQILPVPPETLEVEVRSAVQNALIATTDDLSSAQIREINERAIEFLRVRGVLPSGE